VGEDELHATPTTRRIGVLDSLDLAGTWERDKFAEGRSVPWRARVDAAQDQLLALLHPHPPSGAPAPARGATTLDGNAMNELQLVADSQGGALWFGPDGACYFDGIYALRNRAANTFEGNIFTTVKDSASSSIQFGYSDIEYSYDGSLTKNIFAYSAVGGATQTILDEASRSLYGDRQVSRSDLLCTSDADVLTVATKDLALSKTPEFRVESLTVLPRSETNSTVNAPLNQWDMLFGLCQLRSGCKIIMDRRLGASLPTTLERYCLIQRITHNITPDNWTTSFEFTSATVLRAITVPWDEFLWDSGVWSW
jgi:hypothetical protein